MAERKKYVALVDSVRQNGGAVYIFSSLHVTGERKYHLLMSERSSELRRILELSKLTGIAAILRFPVPEIEEEDAIEAGVGEPSVAGSS